jgi:hypothetical protein
VEVNAEDARQQRAEGHLERSEFHISEQFVDNDLTAKPLPAKVLGDLRQECSSIRLTYRVVSGFLVVPKMYEK